MALHDLSLGYFLKFISSWFISILRFWSAPLTDYIVHPTTFLLWFWTPFPSPRSHKTLSIFCLLFALPCLWALPVRTLRRRVTCPVFYLHRSDARASFRSPVMGHSRSTCELSASALLCGTDTSGPSGVGSAQSIAISSFPVLTIKCVIEGARGNCLGKPVYKPSFLYAS